jgi:hypothetical protein
MPYLTYKDHYFSDLQINTEDRQRISTLIAAACNYVEAYCNRQFEKQEHTRVYQVQPDGCVILDNPPIDSIDEIEVYGDGWTVYTGAFFCADNGILEGGFGRGKIRVTYTSGYSDVPEAIKLATANLVKASLAGSGGRLQSEKIGDYSYTLAPAESMPMSDKKILNLWKDRRI